MNLKLKIVILKLAFSSLCLSFFAQGETILYEAKNATLNDCTFATTNSGFSGDGYADFNGVGASVEWTVTTQISGVHDITLHYASANSRPVDIEIDGLKMGTFSIPATGQWTQWNSETLPINMTQGQHNLTIVASTSTGPNVNWLSIAPIKGMSLPPQDLPTSQPTAEPQSTASAFSTTNMLTSDFAQSVVLNTNSYLSLGQFIASPSGSFTVGLSNSGDLVMKDNQSNIIWSAGISGGAKCFMQGDGNVIIRDPNLKALWATNTSQNPGAQLIVDDGGCIAVVCGNMTLWMDGIPRGHFTGPASNSLQFPLRGIFYYPWYPETWTVNGNLVHFEPQLGFYKSSDPKIAEAHVDSLEYANVDLSIASWWGQGTLHDRSRITLLMETTIMLKSNLKWTVYYEGEYRADPSPSTIQNDLNYLKKWFAWHKAWANIDGRPVIFVYNADGCNVANQWMQASQGEWFVVLKLFPGFETCSIQPDSWHQYGPAVATINLQNHSFSVSPGFWRADVSTPLLPRLSKQDFCQNIFDMVLSGAPWQLITTFNEAGEGTMVENSNSWQSSSGYGDYLDCLHSYVTI